MSYKIRLSTEEAYILADKMQEIQNKKLSRRLLAISLRHYGYKVKEIALLVGASEKTVTGWFKLFLEGGFDRLLSLKYASDRNSKLRPYQEAIRTFRRNNPQAELQELHKWLQAEHHLTVEFSWLYRYVELHNLW